MLVVSLPVFARRLTCAFGCTVVSDGTSGVFGVTFLKMWRTFPSLSSTVLTYSYPGTFPASSLPFSNGFSGFPFSSVHVVVLSTTGVVTLRYTLRIFPFSSFSVLTIS